MPDPIGVVTGLKVEAALVKARVGRQDVLCATGLGPGPAAVYSHVVPGLQEAAALKFDETLAMPRASEHKEGAKPGA